MERVAVHPPNVANLPLVSKKRNTYTVGKKQSILSAAAGDKFPIVKAAKLADIDPDVVRKWLPKRGLIEQALPTKRKLHAGPALKRPNVEAAIMDYVGKLRNFNLPVTTNQIVAHILQAFPAEFLQEGNNDDMRFNACKKWLYDAMDRLNLSQRRKTHNTTALSEEEMGRIHLDYTTHIRNLMHHHSIADARTINMDETGCYFDADNSKTIEFKGIVLYSILP